MNLNYLGQLFNRPILGQEFPPHFSLLLFITKIASIIVLSTIFQICILFQSLLMNNLANSYLSISQINLHSGRNLLFVVKNLNFDKIIRVSSLFSSV